MSAGPRVVLAGVLARFAGVQMIVQVLTALTGFLVVRSLSRDDYAAYSLATAVAGGCGVIAHSGFNSAILARGAQVRHDREALSRLLASAMSYRRRVTMGLVGVGSAVLLVLLRRIDAPIGEALLLTLATAVTVGLSAGVAIHNELLTLEYRRSVLQRVGLVGAALRLLGQALLAVSRSASAVATAVLQALVLLVVRHLQRSAVRDHIDLRVPPDADEVTHVRRPFLHLLPGNVLYVVQGQLVVLLIAVLGHGGTVADLGAVTRYSMVFGVFGATVVSVLVPMIARAPHSVVMRRYAAICAAALLVGATGFVAVMVFTDPLLMLLGDTYRGLQAPLRITFGAAALGTVADVMSSLNQGRGWVRGAWTQLPGAVTTLAVTIVLVDVTTTTGAAILSAALVLPGIATQLVQLVLGLKAERLAPVSLAPTLESV